MRRKDREVTDFKELLAIISTCDVCRIAFFDKDYPYIIPMNFGLSVQENELELYFHCAKEGKKLDLARTNSNVGFEMDCSHRLITEESDYSTTMEYESICGNGVIEILSEEEKVYGLTQIMKQYVKKEAYDFEDKEMQFVTIFKIRVQNIWGKRLKKS